MVGFGQFAGREFGIFEDCGDNGDGLRLAFFADTILLFLRLGGIFFQGMELFFAEFCSFTLKFAAS